LQYLSGDQLIVLHLLNAKPILELVIRPIVTIRQFLQTKGAAKIS
jgi:hypothetical protein